MYQPAHFLAPDAAAVRELVRDYPLASLVLKTEPGHPLSVDPVVLSCAGDLAQGGQLLGHIARANPLAEMQAKTMEVTAIFTGARAYVTPNWYPSKQAHHRVVPTFNYCTVVIHGKMQLIEQSEQKLEIVRALTRQMEGDDANAWSVDDAPPEYIEQMLKAITGLRIEIEQVQAKFKISQNREPLDKSAVQMELESSTRKSDSQVMAYLMERLQTN